MKLLKIISFLLFFPLFSFAQETAADLMERAEFLIQNVRYEEALTMLDAAIKKDPSNYKVYHKKADALVGIGRFEDAIKELETAVSKKVDYTQGYEMLADLYYQIRNASKAVQNYDLAYKYEQDPENKLRYKLEIISLLYTVNRHKMAERHLKEAKELVPDMFDIKFLEAQFYNETDQYDKALPLMEAIIKEVPEGEGNEEYFYEYGRALHFTGNYAKAEEVFKKADAGEFRLKLQQFSPEYYYDLANIYYGVYAYELSQKNNTVALTMRPGYAEALQLQQKLEAVKKDKTKDIEIQEKLIKTEKDPAKLANMHYDLALYHYQSGGYQFSISACDNSIKIDPRNLNVIFLKAMSEYKLNMAEDATSMLDKIVKNPKLDPRTKAKFSFALGLIYENAGKLDEAQEAFQNSYGGEFKNAASSELLNLFKARQAKQTEQDEY